MDWLTDWLIGFASDRNHPAGLATLAASALLEYVVPPFPGDTITLLGAILITGYGWNGLAIVATVVAGSLAGALFDYWLGLRLRARPRRSGSQRWARIDRLVARFERHGPAYLIINRFVPGIRPLFFVAAGMAGMPRRDVILYGGLSVALWNAVLIGLGAMLGANLETLEHWMAHYNTAAWTLLGSGALVYLAYRLIRWSRRRGRR